MNGHKFKNSESGDAAGISGLQLLLWRVKSSWATLDDEQLIFLNKKEAVFNTDQRQFRRLNYAAGYIKIKSALSQLKFKRNTSHGNWVGMHSLLRKQVPGSGHCH